MRWVGVVALLFAGGCKNACQSVCVQMASYAEDCGEAVSDGELDACFERQSAAEGEDLKACREFGDPEVVRAQWTCEDLHEYWSENGG